MANFQAAHDAADLLRVGDQANALALLHAKIDRGPQAPAEDVQVATQLVQIAHWLANEAHPQAANTAALAIQQIAVAQAGPKTGAWLPAMAGELYEAVIGDPAKAKLNYQAALRIDPQQSAARLGLARLQALDALVAAKARENAALGNRPKLTHP